MATETGTVKWFDAAKGFGFITQQNGSDIFVHHTDIVTQGQKILAEGQKVQFEVGVGAKGAQAKSVTPV